MLSGLLWNFHGKGQHQLGQGERSFKGVLFPNRMTNLGGMHTLLPAIQLILVWDTEKPWRGIPGPFQALSKLVLPEKKNWQPPSGVGENSNFSRGRPNWCRLRKFTIGSEPPQSQPLNYPANLGFHTLAIRSTLYNLLTPHESKSSLNDIFTAMKFLNTRHYT